MDMIETLTQKLNTPNLTTEEAAANAMAVYNQAAGNIEAFKIIQEQAKRLLEEIIIETGQDKWETDFARCYITKPGVTVRYNTSALDALAASNKKIELLLAPHRTETERAGTLTIRRR